MYDNFVALGYKFGWTRRWQCSAKDNNSFRKIR
jgi:hypothetical protein